MKFKILSTLITGLLLSSINIASAAEPIKFYASKTKGDFVPSNAYDGDINSRWAAKGEGEYIQFKFEEAVTLEAIQIAFLKGDSRKVTFQIESTDTPWSASVVWDQQPLMVSDGSSSELQTYELESPVTAKFFRIVGYGFVGKWGWENDLNSITETKFIDYVEDDEGLCEAVVLNAFSNGELAIPTS